MQKNIIHLVAMLDFKRAAFLMLFSISEIESETVFLFLYFCCRNMARKRILNFKMAASYHGNQDGYLALKNSSSSSYTCANFHAFVKKVNDFRP